MIRVRHFLLFPIVTEFLKIGQDLMKLEAKSDLFSLFWTTLYVFGALMLSLAMLLDLKTLL